MEKKVRELLSKRDLRHLAIIDYLLEHSFVTIKEMSSDLSISSKTISLDIKDINSYIANVRIDISFDGVTLVMPKNVSSRYLYHEVLMQSREIEIIEKLFFNTHNNLEALADEFYLSEITLRRSINDINKRLKALDIKINIKKMIFTGSEISLLLLMTNILSKKYYSTSWYINDKQLSVLNEILECMIPDKNFNYPDLEKLRQWLYLKITLIKKKGIKINEEEYKGYSPNISDSLREEFHREFATKLTTENLYYMFEQFQNDKYLFSYDRLLEIVETNQTKAEMYEKVNSLIKNIEHTLKIDCPNKDELVLDIFNIINLPDIPSLIICSRNKSFIDNLPLSLEPVLSYTMGLLNDCFKDSLKEHQINELLYIIFTHWSNFIANLSKSVGYIKVGVFYDNDIEHTTFICEALTEASPVDVEPIILQEIDISTIEKMLPNIDLLVTNIPNIESAEDKVICTDDFPSMSDWRTYRVDVLRIYNEKVIELINNKDN